MGRKAHLSPAEAEEAREMYRGPWKPSQIARYFDVSTAVVHAVLNRTGAYKETSQMTTKTNPVVTLVKPSESWPLYKWTAGDGTEREEFFERGERIIVVGGRRWGRTRVKSIGPRGLVTTFEQDDGGSNGDTIAVPSNYSKSRTSEVKVYSPNERRSRVYKTGHGLVLPEGFKTNEMLVLEKAQELVASGLLRDPDVVKAEIEERRRLSAERMQAAQKREDEAFRERAKEALFGVRLLDGEPTYAMLLDSIVKAMRWAQER